MSFPRVGVGVIIQNEEGKILVGKRRGSHAPYYSIPGGSMELGETFEAAAIREVKEETGLNIKDITFVNVTNNIKTYHESGVHFVSINFITNKFEGSPRVMEPEKCESWQWLFPEEIPEPHFEASKEGVKTVFGID